MFSELRWEVIVCFVDIGGIDDHYCLNFLFCELRWEVIIDGIDVISFLFQWVKMRGDCLFWYWWNWWPLLFKLSFLCCFVFSELRWEVIVCFVDIGGIDDHYCLNFLFCVQWVKMRGDCLFCWYWWNWWPLLFKLSFLFSELRWEVIVCFVDIGGIDDHYCLNFLFCVQWVKMRGDCLFCWYWWNWWPLLFKLSFLCSVS